MATIATISAALNLIDVKKENLRKALEDLHAVQSNSSSSSSSSLPLNWSDLDSHFSSLQSSLQHKFNLLQSIEPSPPPQSQLPAKQPSPSVPARAKLKSFCQSMDGIGLRRYLTDRRLHRTAIKVELPDAYGSAPDAAALVLDAMEGFYGEDAESSNVRGSCLIMLEELMRLMPVVISDEVRAKALKVAMEWKEKMVSLDEGEKPTGLLGFLHLVAVYGLAYAFGVNELIDYVIVVAKRRQTIDLCRSVFDPDKIPHLIQKLISNGNRLVAVKFSYEFQKTDIFPLVPLLKEHRQETTKLSEEVHKDGKSSLQSLNEAMMKEISALKSIIKCIEDYHLESEYPKHTLVNILEKLENEKASRKRLAAVPAPKPQKLKTMKQPRRAAPTAPESKPKSDTNAFPPQQPHVQTAGLLPDRSAQYMSLQAGTYGVAGAAPAIQHTGSNASPYGYAGGPLGFNGNPISSGSNLYPSELHTSASRYYDVPIPYGGYGLPSQYHPSYYPQ